MKRRLGSLWQLGRRNLTHTKITGDGAGWGCVECKKNMYGGLAEYLKPIQEKRRQLAKDEKAVDEILQAGAAKASELANQTLEEARRLCKLTGKPVP